MANVATIDALIAQLATKGLGAGANAASPQIRNAIKRLKAVDGGGGKSPGGSMEFNSAGDSLRRTMGPARLNNADELADIIADLNRHGVDVSHSPGEFVYGAARGRPGNLRIDKDASISAWRHEYGHFLDDKALGYPGIGHYLQNPSLKLASERRSYLGEIRTARKLGDQQARKELIEAYLSERAIYGKK